MIRFAVRSKNCLYKKYGDNMANFPSDSHRFEGLGSLTIQFFFLKDYIYIYTAGWWFGT